MSRQRPILALGALAILAGCVGQFDAPSAYETQRFLCDPANAQAYADAVSACREADGGCGGVLSFQGTLEGRPVVVESSLTGSQLSVLPQPDGGAPLVDEVEVLGASPYFTYNFKLRSLGGSWPRSAGARVRSPSPPLRTAFRIRSGTTRCSPSFA
jgi:hypothetical protein